jgi:hypothetical protein
MVTASANYTQNDPYVRTSTGPPMVFVGAVERRRQSSSLPLAVFEQNDLRCNCRVENNRRPRLRAGLGLTAEAQLERAYEAARQLEFVECDRDPSMKNAGPGCQLGA